jgi:hypothetical protein
MFNIRPGRINARYNLVNALHILEYLSLCAFVSSCPCVPEFLSCNLKHKDTKPQRHRKNFTLFIFIKEIANRSLEVCLVFALILPNPMNSTLNIQFKDRNLFHSE